MRGWSEPAYNATVQGGYQRLEWPLAAQDPADLVAEVHARGEKLLAYSGLTSLADIDWVYWKVLQFAPGEVVQNRVPMDQGETPLSPTPLPAFVEAPTFEWLLAQTLWEEDALRLLIETLTGSSPQVVLAGRRGPARGGWPKPSSRT